LKYVNGRTKVGSVFVAKFVRGFFDIVFFFTGGIQAINPENVPSSGGVIIAPIHLSHLDPPALACTMRHRRLLAMAKEELWKNKAFGWLIAQIGAHPVKRGEGDTESIRWCLEQLSAGHALLVFPEGTRGDGTHLLSMARGVAMLAKKSDVPVVPVGIVGTHRILPHGSGTRQRSRITVAYGKPLRYSDFAQNKPDTLARTEFLRALAKEIANLCQTNGLPIVTADADVD
jgi:1-acyl-sn-glycerol-3-phosphate acyltransferase